MNRGCKGKGEYPRGGRNALPTTEKRVSKSLTLHPQVVDWVDTQRAGNSFSRFIEKILRKEMIVGEEIMICLFGDDSFRPANVLARGTITHTPEWNGEALVVETDKKIVLAVPNPEGDGRYLQISFNDVDSEHIVIDPTYLSQCELE